MPTAEEELLAVLDSFEKSTTSIAKGGDALQNAPHDGGFATEGTNIQSKAGVKKSAIANLVKGGMKQADAEQMVESLMKGDMGGDDDSMSDAPGDDEDEASDEGSDAPPPMMKSTGAAQLANATSKRSKTEESIRKSLSDEHNNAIDAVPVLGELVKTIDTLAKSINTQGDAELRKSVQTMQTVQSAFNNKVARALTIIAKSCEATNAAVARIEAQPAVQHRAPTLRKSDIVEPQFHGNGQEHIGGNGNVAASPLSSVPMLEIQNALVEMVMKGGADVMDVTKFENSKGNFSMLPPNVVAQLEKRFATAASS